MTAEAYEADRRLIWGLCYRMTGNAADADDLAQETFVRALERPPARQDQPLRPWLVRVAMNLSRDLLRRRRRRDYRGPWLPTPVPTDEGDALASFEPIPSPEPGPASRYELIESISFAFLLALEALTPSQRAVLLLRDVFDYSTEETAEALGLSEANVKVLLHRARRRMREYDKGRGARAGQNGAAQRALERFLMCLRNGDADGLEKLLAEDVVSLSDSGGEVAAAMRPVSGRSRVLRLILGLAGKRIAAPAVTFTTLNGQPAVVLDIPGLPEGFARRVTMQFDLDADGLISRIYTVLAPSKLVRCQV